MTAAVLPKLIRIYKFYETYNFVICAYGAKHYKNDYDAITACKTTKNPHKLYYGVKTNTFPSS